MFFLQKEYVNVITQYRRSYDLAVKTGNNLLTTRTLSNSARVLLAREDLKTAEASLKSAYVRHMALPDSHDKAYGPYRYIPDVYDPGIAVPENKQRVDE